MKHKIATIINYCTNDYYFIGHNIKHASKFSQQIIVPYCDHFYDGTPENKNIIRKTIKENPQAKFIPFAYNPQKTITIWRGWALFLRFLGLGQVFGPQYWICLARKIGFQHLNPKINYVLFLDADEIIDSARFIEWLNTKKYQALKLANFWYWRKSKYQATTWEDSPLMARYSALKQANFMSHDERNAMFKSIPHPKASMVLGLDRKPMIHHYGWAKPKKNLIKKIQTWGHNKDRNWIKLINQEFSRPFSGTDFIYHRKFKTVKPFLNIT